MARKRSRGKAAEHGEETYPLVLVVSALTFTGIITSEHRSFILRLLIEYRHNLRALCPMNAYILLQPSQLVIKTSSFGNWILWANCLMHEAVFLLAVPNLLLKQGHFDDVKCLCFERADQYTNRILTDHRQCSSFCILEGIPRYIQKIIITNI